MPAQIQLLRKCQLNHIAGKVSPHMELYDPTSIDLTHICVFHLKRLGYTPAAHIKNRWDLFDDLCTYPQWVAHFRALDATLPDDMPMLELYALLAETSPRVGLCIDTVCTVVIRGQWDLFVMDR